MILDDNFHEEQEIHLSNQEIFAQIWTKPRRVFRYLQSVKNDKFVALLLVLAGIANALDRASGRNYGDNMSLWAVLGLCILTGALFGWIGYYIYALLIKWTGNWLNGKAEREDILRVIAFAAIPVITATILLIPQLMVFGNEIFQGEINLDKYGIFSTIFFTPL